MSNLDRSPPFVPILCPCGRRLRAKVELIGTEIRCWDCQQTVPVLLPREARRVASELSGGVAEVIDNSSMRRVLLLGALVTMAFCVPVVGLLLVFLLLTVAAYAYGEIVRRNGIRPESEPDPGHLPWVAPRSRAVVILGPIFAAGIVVPLWLNHLGKQHSPHWDPPGLAVAALVWLGVPILLLFDRGRDHLGRLGWRRGLRVLARHPVAALLALALVPATLVLLEVGLGLLFYYQGTLPFFALEYMPIPKFGGEPLFVNGHLYYGPVGFNALPQGPFIAAYHDGLRRGYSFTAALPPALTVPSRYGLDASTVGLAWWVYNLFRLVLVMAIVTCLLMAWAIQAQWLGALPAIELRRGRPRPPLPANI